MTKILITGANGQLGCEIRELSQASEYTFLFTDKEELDITDEAAISDYFATEKPDYCINCAAYTAVDKAEEERALATLINETAARNLAKAAAASGCGFIHISTDFVFGGSQTGLLPEDAETRPVNFYGESKLMGEQAVMEAHPEAVIYRTSWLYSSFGGNFVKTMLRLGKERDSLGVVADQVGTPTYARDLAEVALAAVAQLEGDEAAKIKGELFHYSNEGTASWYDFAHAIFEYGGIEVNLRPIRTEEYPTPADRPRLSVMDKSKIKDRMQITIPHWRESLQACLQKIEVS